MKRKLYFYITVLLIIASFHTSAEAAGSSYHWTALARHVGQTERSRDAAIRELRKIKNLDQTLLKSIGTSQKPLALDVITALELTHLVPELLKKIDSDKDGFLVLTLNSLLSEKNKTSVIDRYLELLKPTRQSESSAPALVAMLEPLGRLGVSLSLESVEKLFEHSYPEVRSAALYYVRMMTLMKLDRSYLKFINKALSLSPYQVRLQALYVLDEMATKSEYKGALKPAALKERCKAEKKKFVREHCLKIADNLKGEES